VVVYNSNFFKRDTLKNYYDLIDSKWQGKQLLYDEQHPTRKSFERNIRLLLKSKAPQYLQKWKLQSNKTVSTNAELFNQLNLGKGLFSICRLSDYIQFTMKSKRKTNLAVLFPNQRKKGCYLDVSPVGIYRYSKNPVQAKALLTYLTGTSAQFSFADGRNEYPVVQGVTVSYRLKKYEQFRARFYRRKNS
jgi:iron(III) transport system substrate-binding protein